MELAIRGILALLATVFCADALILKTEPFDTGNRYGWLKLTSYTTQNCDPNNQTSATNHLIYGPEVSANPPSCVAAQECVQAACVSEASLEHVYPFIERSKTNGNRAAYFKTSSFNIVPYCYHRYVSYAELAFADDFDHVACQCKALTLPDGSKGLTASAVLGGGQMLLKRPNEDSFQFSAVEVDLTNEGITNTVVIANTEPDPTSPLPKAEVRGRLESFVQGLLGLSTLVPCTLNA